MRTPFKDLRKAAIRLGAVTHTGLEFLLNMPVRDFIELNNEVADEWSKQR